MPPELLQEHTGIPTLAAVCEARAALEDIGLYGTVQLVIAGGLRHGSDCAKALAWGRRVLSGDCTFDRAELQQADLRRGLSQDRRGALFVPPLPYRSLSGRNHDPGPRAGGATGYRKGAERVANFFHALTSEIQILARACGKSNVHHLEPEDLRALTLEASLVTGLPLAGTNRVFGGGPGWKEWQHLR